MESRASLHAVANVTGPSGALEVGLPHSMRKPKQLLHWRVVRGDQCMAGFILNCGHSQQLHFKAC